MKLVVLESVCPDLITFSLQSVCAHQWILLQTHVRLMESVFVGLESLVWSCQQCVENYFQTLQGCAGETILVLRCVLIAFRQCTF